jgi:hypothetical protein
MTAPTGTRSTAGFRNFNIFELTAAGLPLGSQVLEPFTTYAVSGSTISGSSVSVTAATAVTGPIPYYGAVVSGGQVLTINDPAPRVIPHLGDDGVINLQVLPPQESLTGELTVDKTSDTIDSVVSNVNKFTLGEMKLMGQSTSKRGFENQVGALAYSASQEADITSPVFGNPQWDFRVMPKVILFTRDTGYQQQANTRMYTVTPQYVTSHLWGPQFTCATEGFTRAQLIRGVSEYKPAICSFLADGSTQSFPFDAAKPAQSTAKITVWVDGVITTAGFTKTVYGIIFATAPTSAKVITVLYETSSVC